MAVAGAPLSRQDDVVAAVEDLVPMLRRNARDAELAGRLPDENVQALTEAGAFRMSTPRRYGGLQADLPVQFEVMRTIARGCGSSSWVCALYAVCNWWASLFGDEVQDEVFADADVRVAGLVSPRGSLTPAAGGFVLSGTWPFNTGCLHAQWNVVATLRPHEDGSMEPYLALVPMHEMRILDDWHVSGMAATGSNSSVAEDVFVPDARAMPMGPLFGGGHRSERNRDEPLYRYAVFPFLLSSSYGTPIGMAQGAMEAFLELVPGRTTSFEDPTPQAESPNAQLDVAEAAMEIESCLLLARRATGLIHERGVAGEPVTKAERVRARADVAFTTRRSLGVVQRLSAISGASSARLDIPIQRYLRDASTLANHAVLNYEANMTLLGRELLGLDPRTPFL